MDLRKLPSLPHWLLPLPKVRIGLTYLWRHRRWPDLRRPRRFTELVQQRKLEDRNPLLPAWVDKISAKQQAAQMLGERWIIPTRWTGNVLPAGPPAPFPFILKASHGCNQNAVCHDAADWQAARRRAAGWTRRAYGLWLDEWAYRDLPRGYIVEPFLGSGDRLPVDYKIYVFGGHAVLVQVHLDRGRNHRWTLYDRAWTQVSMPDEAPSSAPANLDRMLAAAETLARPFDFARIDFYEIDGQPKFGEVTFRLGARPVRSARTRPAYRRAMARGDRGRPSRTGARGTATGRGLIRHQWIVDGDRNANPDETRAGRSQAGKACRSPSG